MGIAENLHHAVEPLGSLCDVITVVLEKLPPGFAEILLNNFASWLAMSRRVTSSEMRAAAFLARRDAQ